MCLMDSSFYNPRLLVLWRESAGLSQDDVAGELGVARATINRVENGSNASIEILYALADFYRKPVTEVLKPNRLAPAA